MNDNYILDFEDLKQFEYKAKQDSYDFNGVKVPRVTKIIDTCIHEEYLVKWANSLGFKHQSYQKVLQEAANYGSKVHNAIEHHLKDDVQPIDVPNNPFEAFKSWWKILNDNNKVVVLGQEFKLSCPWFGGTYDMLISINDRPWLVDFKTSNHLSYRYCLQLSAYRYMLRYNNIVIPDIAGIIVLRLDKESPSFEEYVLDLSIPEHLNYLNICEHTFFSMAYTYWNLQYIKANFVSINKEM